MVRGIRAEDTKDLWRYINAISRERTFNRFQGERISLAFEKKYVQGQLARARKKLSTHLVMYVGKELAGASSVEMSERITAHVAVFGIAVAKKFRGRGLGELLMRTVLKEARARMPQLRIVRLIVDSNNKIGRSLYKKVGFKEYGRLPKAMYRHGRYSDEIGMYKRV